MPNEPTPQANTGALEDRDSDFNLVKDNSRVRFQPNHALMSRPQLRERDMRPQGLFFYQRLTDDKIICFTEAEASLMQSSSHKHILRQIGVSDGSAYTKAIRSCGVKPGEIIDGDRARKILEEAFEAELESARGHYRQPQDQNVHFDDSFPLDQRPSFVPPR